MVKPENVFCKEVLAEDSSHAGCWSVAGAILQVEAEVKKEVTRFSELRFIEIFCIIAFYFASKF